MSPILGSARGAAGDRSRWLTHWQSELDAAYLYAELARAEPDQARREVFSRLADVERRHADRWARLLADQGVNHRPAEPTRRVRLFAWVARHFGPGALLPVLHREEGQEVRAYLALRRSMPAGPAGDLAQALARESAEHAEVLGRLAGKTGEPWHHTRSGGLLRDLVYGFNDGLTANFGLVAGVIGASVEPRVVLISGLAGMIADALSMGSSSFLAAKSEREVHEHEIAVEADEVGLMPDLEEEELALLYQAKGFAAPRARRLAHELMADPDRALAEQVREELGIGEPSLTPWREGWLTGLATAVGALVPLVPFLCMTGRLAIWVSFALAMAAHFAVGAGRSLFTGRRWLLSGLDMFAVGLGVAAVGYLIGHLVSSGLVLRG